MASQSKKTSWKLKDGEPFTQVELASILHISDRQLRRLVDKMPEHCRKHLPDAVSWLVNRDLTIADTEDTVEDTDRTLSVDELRAEKLLNEVKKLRHDANRSKISEEKERHDFDVQKGIYVERRAVEHRIADVSKQLGDKLFAMPARVSSLLMQAKSEAEIKHILNTGLREVTSEIDEMEIFE